MGEIERLIETARRAGIPPAPDADFDFATNRPLGPPTSWADEWGDDEGHSPEPGN